MKYDYSKLDFTESMKKAGTIRINANGKFWSRTKEDFLRLVKSGKKDKQLHQFFTTESIKRAAKATTKEVATTNTTKNDK